jgi:hypothetical protein
MRSFHFVSALVVTSAIATGAHADRVGPGSHSVGSVTQIGAGVKELSLETDIGFHSDTTKGATDGEPDTTVSGLSLVGAGVFRYFVSDNLALGIHAGGFYRSNGTKSGDAETKQNDAGFIGSVTLAYYASLGGGMFIAPLVGGGFFAGSREDTITGVAAVTGAPTTFTNRASVSGGIVRAGLGIVFYSSGSFNVFARPEALIWIGSAKPKNDGVVSASAPDSRKFTTIDGGFTCGLSYVF